MKYHGIDTVICDQVESNPRDFNKSENPKNPPHIAVWTTAGTGSETSWAYVITDSTTG